MTHLRRDLLNFANMYADSLELLERVTKALEAQQIEFMVSGSVAMNIYATPRMTRDIDIVIALWKYNVPEFLSIFKEGFYIYEPAVQEEVMRRGMFNVIDHKSGYKIDFMLLKGREEYRELEFSRRQKRKVNGFETWVVAVEDLIISKLIWIQDYQSDRQSDDIQNLLQNPAVDLDYVRLWCKNLQLKTYELI